MMDAGVLAELGYVVAGAAAMLLAGRLLRFPPIVSYLAAGLVLGPLSGLLEPSGSLHLFSEIGVALLLFLVGLELSLERIREVGAVVLFVGTVQVALTAALGGVLGLALGFAPVESVLLGLVAAFSSTVVVVRLLENAGGLRHEWGRIAVGVLLVQDVLVAVALTLVAGLGPGGEAIGSGLLAAFGGMLALVLGAVLAVRIGSGTLFGKVAGEPEALVVLGLTWCFGFLLAAEALHLSVELGAFVAGVALAQLPESRELTRRVHPLVSFFLAVFFVALGAGLDPGGSRGLWIPLLAFSLLVLLVKPAAIAGLVAVAGRPARTSVLAALPMGQVSEFGFVLVGLAVEAGLANGRVSALTGLLGLVTIAASSVLAPGGGRLAARRLGPPGGVEVAGGGGAARVGAVSDGAARWDPGPDEAPPGGHVLVIGMNALGRRIVRGLAERGERVVALDTDPRKLAGLPVSTRIGDARLPSVLEEAGYRRARLVVSALRIEGLNALLAYRCRRAGVSVVVHAFDPDTVDELLEAGADHLMVPKQDAVFTLADRLRRAGEPA